MIGNFLLFWRKDWINKLIILIAAVIAITLVSLAFTLLTLPGAASFVTSFIPSPTLSVDEIFRKGEQTTTAIALRTQTYAVPTITTLPFTPLAKATLSGVTDTPTRSVPSPTKEPAETSAPLPSATPTQIPSPTPTPTVTPTLTPASSATLKPVASSGACRPSKNEQTGKVLEVIDGTTVRVLIADLVYVVRYIGLDLPQDALSADQSRQANAQLVYAKEIKLYSDVTDKDDSLRLLRYVVVGGSTLVNQELIRQGLAIASISNHACVDQFQTAEQQAKSDRVGMWKAGQP